MTPKKTRPTSPKGSQAESPFNPLEKEQLAASVVRALLERSCQKLPLTEPFDGAGIYVLYYFGEYRPYARLAAKNAKACDLPIYVGRAQHAGARKGLLKEQSKGQPLYSRLNQHARSITATANLSLDDFRCRYLVVDDLWVPLAERLLLDRYRPLWNVTVEGFGIHDPGAGRHRQKRSHWDVLHLGRKWVARLAPGKLSEREVMAKIEDHLKEI